MIAIHASTWLLRQKTQAVVFDLDGTLVDAFEDIAAATNHVLAELGHAPLSSAEITVKVGHGVAQLLRDCLPPETPEELIRRGLERWRAYYHQHPVRYARVYSGGHDMLRQLKQAGLRRGVLSNKLHDLTVAILDRLGLAEEVDLILGETGEFPRKPQPDSLLAMIRQLGAEPETTLMIGDGGPDMQVARNAGAWPVGITSGLLTRHQLVEQGAAVTIDQLVEVPQLLQTL